MPRIGESEFVARHAFQRLNTSEARQDPKLQQVDLQTADVDRNGEISGAPELSRLYRQLVALEGSTPSAGVDLESQALKPVYSALSVRFSQLPGVEGRLGQKALKDVAELKGVFDGNATIKRTANVMQLGVGSMQEALNLVSVATKDSSIAVNLGAGDQYRGLFGPGTERAVTAFQRRSNLPATGVVDKATLTALDTALAATRPTPTTPTTPTTGTPGPGAARFTLPAFADILAGRTTMVAGARGDAVKAVQQAMLDMGFPMLALKNDVGVSGVDGAFGQQTTTAIKNFQIFAQKRQPGITANGVLDKATLTALLAFSPAPGMKAWDAGQPNHAPPPRYEHNGQQHPLRIVVVQDEHRTFLYDAQGACTGIFPNAQGAQGNATEAGLKRIRTRLDEGSARATGVNLWGDDRAFGKRIVDLSWFDGRSSGEELHGTYDYRTMGQDVSHGCVRHYNEDILTMFSAVAVGDLVAIVKRADDSKLVASSSSTPRV